MEEKKKMIWFPAKKYGFGWGLPLTWQGWVVLLIYTLMIVAGSFVIGFDEGEILLLLAYVFLLTLCLIFICWKKGEKPQWRWGIKKPRPDHSGDDSLT